MSMQTYKVRLRDMSVHECKPGLGGYEYEEKTGRLDGIGA
jgi:hypothetical protein